MENYIVSARKYRPTSFDEVIGQEALTTTLKNAISTGKLAHAYLFCGPRGVGKTTCARIFAKTINCSSPKENGEACNECESCRSFNEQRSLNVHELDAASNNSVEDIRTLCDQVQILPQIGKYKVFIIDEVHMLSTSAFNAFLKTLEEPPAHAIFILATTEKHKILPTILSRCQIYDFSRMDIADTVNHLKHVAEAENIKYEEEALNVIARKADGGMRDALSIFDQVASFTGGEITYKKVIEDLNILDYDYYFSLTDKLLSGDISGAMLTFNEILGKGFDAGLFISGLGGHFRDLLMSQDTATQKLVEVADAQRERYREQSARCKAKFLYRAIKICSDCEQSYRTSKNKRLLVEISLIEVAQSNTDDESAGRSPEKKLKPIFKESVGKSQEQVAVAQKSAEQSKQQVRVAIPAEPLKQTVAQTDRTLRISIRQAPKPTENKEPETLAATPKSIQIDTVEDFAESDLLYQWLRFASALPKEQTAMAARMKNMRPTLQDNFVISVVVDNEQVAQQMNGLKVSLLNYLKSNLRNGLITLDVRILELNEPARAYSKKEQFDTLMQKSEEMRLLCKNLRLEMV